MRSLDVDLASILEEFGAGVEREVEADFEQAGTDFERHARAESPKDSGVYAGGWRHTTRTDGAGVTVTCGNASRHATLSHLIEHGHEQFYMGRDLGYRQPANNHVERAYDATVADLNRRLGR